jgi:hypothetical protein
VIFTALLRISTPRRMRSRASVEKRTSFAAEGGVMGEHKKRGVNESRASIDGDETDLGLWPIGGQ